MKVLTKEMLSLAALAALMILLGALCLLTLRSKRSSRLYRLKVSILGLIVVLWGGGTGCYKETSKVSLESGDPDGRDDPTWMECYRSDPEYTEDPVDDRNAAEGVEASCYVPVDIREEVEPIPEAGENMEEGDEDAEENDEAAEAEDERADAEDEPEVD